MPRPRVRGSLSPYRTKEGHRPGTEGEIGHIEGEIGHIEGEMVIVCGPRVRGSMSPYRAKQGPRTSSSPYRTKEGHCTGTDRHMVDVPISTERGSSSWDRS